MPFLDFFRNFFNKGAVQEPPQNRYEDNHQFRDSFRNPIWQNDEDEDDISDFNRQPMNRYHFRIDSNPFEMTRFFESQMEHLLRNFFSPNGFGKHFGESTNIFVPFGDDDFIHSFGNPNGRSKSSGPRDEVMKPDYEMPNSIFGHDDFTSIFSMPDTSKKGLCDDILKPSYEIPDSNNPKIDSDLDGKIKSDELAKIWKNSSALEPKEPQLRGFEFGKSVSTQIIRRQDGRIEERRTVKDSHGNEETSVIRQIGDKKHIITSKKAKDGSEEQTENIINMDETELNGFNEKWSRYQKTPKQPITNFEDDFPWHKFFGPNPKL